MKIHDLAVFPNPMRVRIAVNEKGVEDQVEYVDVDVMNGEHRSEKYQNMNPGMGVPILELECGTYLSECTAITEYLDSAFGSPTLTGSNPKQKAVVHMMQRRAEQSVMDAVGTYFHHATEGLGPDLELYQNAEWGEKQKERAVDGMRYFDKVLANNAFVAGEEFSMADITLFCGLGFADFAKIDFPTECTRLSAWREKIAARPSVLALSA